MGCVVWRALCCVFRVRSGLRLRVCARASPGRDAGAVEREAAQRPRCRARRRRVERGCVQW
eukprot:9565971-Alexandrium_andersonii.AAC.1